MRKLLFFLPLFLGIFAACKFDADDLPVERPFTRDFYAEGEWRDTGQTAPFLPFDYTVGRTAQQPFSNVFRSNSQAFIIDGHKQIRANIFGVSGSDPMFYIAFFSDHPAPPNSSPAWSAEELEALLPVGRVFPISGAPLEVEIGVSIPFNSSFNIFSDSKTAPVPGGWVQVLDISDYTWTRANFSGGEITLHGKKVRIAFEAKLGRRAFYSSSWPAVGEAEVRNGEASLYLEHF